MHSKKLLPSLFLLTVLSSASSAATYDCISTKNCHQPDRCEAIETKFQIYDRLPGQARIDMGFLVDMEELLQEKTSRRDWLINGVLNGYAGLVSLYENGSFVYSEHSQDAVGAPVFSALYGSCEVKE